MKTSYCPSCKSDQPHRSARDEVGEVLWCQTCHYVHLPATSERRCGDCHFWHINLCLHAEAMLAPSPPSDCPFWRQRRPPAHDLADT